MALTRSTAGLEAPGTLGRKGLDEIPVCALPPFEEARLRSAWVRQFSHDPHRSQSVETLEDTIGREMTTEGDADLASPGRSEIPLQECDRYGEHVLIAVQRLGALGYGFEAFLRPAGHSLKCIIRILYYTGKTPRLRGTT